ncbi:hypothetical protein CC86DRAFT_386817 [Ophiobolus disseminans]|uniref:Uncharacterized protein n=1 Tax=Ophiobolus disseminans TaxID=1469910 RepID=A0A6A6ZK95_9PLEO|nr:hypothetical protein CC86DRAFT_386817 [Ophiobolus disseminans]
MPLSRRKPYVYKNRVETPKKTERQELSAVERTFCCGAVIGGGATLKEVMQHLPPNSITTSGLSKLVKRVKEKAEEADLKFADPHLYENEVGQGRKELFTPKQKKEII